MVRGGGRREGGGRRGTAGRRGEGSPLPVSSLIASRATSSRRFTTDFTKHTTFPLVVYAGPLSTSLLSSRLYTTHILCIRRSYTELQKRKKKHHLSILQSFPSPHPPPPHPAFILISHHTQIVPPAFPPSIVQPR